jgi:hypothetical protein
MALVSKKDFAEALNISYGTIRSKVSRKQLCCNRKGLIDTENPKNYIYLLEINGGDQSVFEKFRVDSKSNTNVGKKITPTRQTEKKVIVSKTIPKKQIKISESGDFEKVNDSKAYGNSPQAVETQKTTKKIIEETPVVLTAEERKKLREEEKARRDLLDYDLRQRRANAEYKERESELKKMQLEKIAGNTLPLDLTKNILKINCQAILIQFLSSIENMVAVTVEELGGVRSDNVRITNELKKIFKKTVETCEKNAEREIENAVQEYSEVRARGERRA